MALRVSSNGSSSNPTGALQQALSAFDECLTAEQRQQFKALTPHTENVVAFAMDIDARHANRTNTKHSFAQRLLRLLEPTKQFADIVDTFVSSNPTVAALVLGSLKTAILVACNVCSYFGKVTAFILEVGKTCPIYDQFAALYPDSVNLQRSLSDYFAIVVHICIKIVHVSQRSGPAQTLSSIINPFESEFKPFRDRLEDAKLDIKLQISLAAKMADAETKRIVERESSENSLFRSAFYRRADKDDAQTQEWRVRRQRREAEKLRLQTRKNFSAIDYESPLKQAMSQRVPRTTEWLQQEPVFQSWLTDPASSFLWCTGTMGIGKTILVSSIVNQLQSSRKSNDRTAYYFCRADDKQTIRARNILGTLLRQMLDVSITTADKDLLRGLHRRSENFDVLSTSLVVSNNLEDGKDYFLVIDGLDECHDTDLGHMEKFFANMFERFPRGCKILCTGRYGLEKRLFRQVQPDRRLMISRSKVDPDVDRYVTVMVDDCLREGRMRLGDPTLQSKIVEVLRERADGMFLWIRLVIEELCARNSDSEVMEALEHLPRSLSEIFDRILGRIRIQGTGEQATHMLRYCGVARQPLELMQYKELLGVSPGQRSVDRTKYPNSMELVIANCYGLLLVDEDKDTVHFTHRSIQQHFFVQHGPRRAVFDSSNVNIDLGLICMTYLDFEDFKRQMTKVDNRTKTPFNPSELAIAPVSSLSRRLGGVVRRQLQTSQLSVNLDMQEVVKKTQEVVGSPVNSELSTDFYDRGFRFIKYAKASWIYHLADLDTEELSDTWILFSRCIEGMDVLTEHPWDGLKEYEWRSTKIPKMLLWSLYNNNHALLLYHLRRRRNVFTQDVRQFMLEKAVDYDLFHFTQTMILSGLNQREDLQFGLIAAARNGRIDAFKSFRHAGADTNEQVDGVTMLQAAAKSGCLEIVRTLLREGCDVHDQGSKQGDAPLRLALSNDHIKVAEILLHAGAHVNKPPEAHRGKTLLQEVASLGYLDAVDMLIAAGADVNAPAVVSEEKGHGGRTALQAAAEKNHCEVVKRLLEAGADVNALYNGYEGRSALQWAARRGNSEMVELLLDAGADINAPAYVAGGATALQDAANRNHLDTVKRLLARGADVNAPYIEWGALSALQSAIWRDNTEMFCLLLEAGADPKAPARPPQRHDALQLAAKNGNLEMVERLLDAGVDIEPPPTSYRLSARQLAITGGYTAIVERLDKQLPPKKRAFFD